MERIYMRTAAAVASTSAYARLYAKNDSCTLILVTLWLLVVFASVGHPRSSTLADSKSSSAKCLAATPVRAACHVLALARICYLLTNLGVFEVPASISATINAVPLGCTAFASLYCGSVWRTLLISHPVALGTLLLFYWLFTVPTAHGARVALALVGTYWQIGGFALAAWADAQRSQSPLGRLRLACLAVQASCCAISFHAPLFFRSHFGLCQLGAYLGAEWCAPSEWPLEPPASRQSGAATETVCRSPQAGWRADTAHCIGVVAAHITCRRRRAGGPRRRLGTALVGAAAAHCAPADHRTQPGPHAGVGGAVPGVAE
jgi:hypothetical protein